MIKKYKLINVVIWPRRTCTPSPNIEEILEMYSNSELLKNTSARMWLSRQLKRIHIYELKLIMLG